VHAGFLCPVKYIGAHARVKTRVSFVTLAVLLYFSNAAFATTEDKLLVQLSGDRLWQALLHYSSNRLTLRQSSTINSADFFLSPNGNSDPLSELYATVFALSENVVNDADHAQCLFPARYLWLRERVKSVRDAAVVNCTDYQEWLETESIQSVSMVFATGHMKSPASFFGHNFLKLNGAGNNLSKDLLDTTINFGAEVPENEGALTFFYKGIFGGYSALFERQPFFRHMEQYGEEDLRDVWEYELSLSENVLNFLLAHIWELRNTSLTYYFFRKNCAYQISKLLALLTSEKLVPEYVPWTMPYNVIDKLVKVRSGNKSLVHNIRYHPSRRSRFHQRYFNLSADDKKAFTEQIVGSLSLDTTTFNSKSLNSQFALIDALLDYYEFRLRVDESDDIAAREKKKLLLKRFTMPVAQSTERKSSIPSPPHLAQRPGYVSLAAANNSALGSGVLLRIRPAYFDFLGLDIGRSSGGEFTALDTELVFGENRTYVSKFNLLNVTNLAPSITGVPNDRSISWRFRFGYGQTNNACDDCQRLMTDWQIGTASKLNSGLTGYVLGGARLQRPFERDNALALRLTAGVTGELLPGIRLNAFVERHEDTGSNGLDRNLVNLDMRFGSHREWDVRLSYQHEITEQLSISAGYYW